jgi:DNA-binding NarL/FixJ family response regulator
MKILLADDHAIVRDGLQAILASDPAVTLVGATSDGREAVALARKLRPDVVIMDISMPGMNGIVATRQITSELPGTKVVCLSMHSDRRYAIAMFKAGASAYLLKDSAAGELLRAIEAVSHNQTYVCPAIAGAVVEALTKGQPERQGGPLTNRESEVLQLLAEGCTSKEIASRLHIAPATAETHRRQIMSKLDLHTVAELTKFAIREGLTTVER